MSALPEFALSTAAATALLAVAPVALALLRPLYAAGTSELTDFAVDYLNPAGQHLLALEERPVTTLLAAFPDARQTGLLAYCRQEFTAPAASGPPAPFLPARSEPGTELRARRQGKHLAVSFVLATPTSEWPAQVTYPALSQLQNFNSTLLANNAELLHMQQEMQLLNDELEARVSARTSALEQAHEEREERRQQLERLFMQAPAAVCILSGPDLVFELVNPGYEALFPGRELLGRPLLEALPEVRRHAVARTFQQVYETGITHQEMGLCIPFRCPESGGLVDRYFNYMQQARHDEQGHVDGVLVFAFEVSSEVRGRQQVQRLNEELLASNQELGTANVQLTHTNVDLDSFIYAASHDLKEPITNLEGLVQALREVLPPAAAQDALVQPLLGMMEGAVARFQLTIAQLSDVARLQHTTDQAAEDVDLATLAQEIMLDLAPALTAGAQLTVEVKTCPSISFAPQHLRSVVYNLLSNALKYCAPDRPAVVQLRCRREANTAVLEVQDNGIGLDASQQARVFGMFQRVHTHVEGVGIGLYMVKKIVENIGGTVTLRSELGVGSTFIVSLPCAG